MCAWETKSGGGSATLPAPTKAPAAPPAQQQQDAFASPAAMAPKGSTWAKIISIEVDAVVGGALQKLHYRDDDGLDPFQIADELKSAGCKVRDDFPKGGAGFGKKDTLLARAMVINVRVSDQGAFIDITCQNGDDFSCSVTKKNAPEWLGKVKALGKLVPKNIAKLEAAFEKKAAATVILGEAEQFGVKYWKTDDGLKAFLEEMVAEPPAAKAEIDGEVAAK